MNFSWRAFLREHNIEFVSEGPSTHKGNLYIHCPFCGTADHSHHMGLSLSPRQPFYGCWRDSAHRGRHPARLIAALLNCTMVEARELVDASDSSAVDDYEDAVSRWLAPKEPHQEQQERGALEMPRSFRPIVGGRFLEYLEGRGFDHPEKLAAYYRLRYCLVGYFSQRLIIPIYHNDTLVSWTARAVGKAALRYKTLSTDPDTARRQGASPALLPIAETLFNHDRALRGGRTLVVCEGPFDAMKVDWYGGQETTAVGIFGMPKEKQIGLLGELSQRFMRVSVMLDRAAASKSIPLHERLSSYIPNCVWVDLPEGVKDPGELTDWQVQWLVA